MISYENKIKAINAELIDIPEINNPLYGIQVIWEDDNDHHCWMNGEGNLLRRLNFHLFEGKSGIRIGWFRSSSQSFFVKGSKSFDRSGDEASFNSLPQIVKDTVLEYADWFLSDDGQNFVKRMLKMRTFL